MRTQSADESSLWYIADCKGDRRSEETVEPYNEYTGSGTGFSFANYNAHEMLHVIEYAKSVYYGDREAWNRIVDRAMAADFSWGNSARKYEDLYRSL